MTLIWQDLSQGIIYVPSPFGEIPEFTPASFTTSSASLRKHGSDDHRFFLYMDNQSNSYLLSQNPLASCFFCGNGGPESVMALYFNEKPSFKMDDVITVRHITSQS